MISSLYTEPGTSFDFSYRIIRLFGEVLTRRIMQPYGLDKKDKEVGLSLMISTKRECHKTEAKGPDWDKRNKCLTWGLWLPYNEIIQSANPVEVFIGKFFDAAGMALSSYGVKTEDIEQAKDEVKKEVVGNESYNKANDPLPDLSKIKF